MVSFLRSIMDTLADSTNCGRGVVQRFVYDPYGSAAVLTAGWSATTDTHGWAYRHQAGRYNAVTNLHHFRHRDHAADKGRWMTQDPAIARRSRGRGVNLNQCDDKELRHVGLEPTTR